MFWDAMALMWRQCDTLADDTTEQQVKPLWWLYCGCSATWIMSHNARTVLQLWVKLLLKEFRRSVPHRCLCYNRVRPLTGITPHEHIWIEIDSPVDIPLSSVLIETVAKEYPSENHLKVKYQEISLIPNMPSCCRIVLKLCTEHGSDAFVICAKIAKRLDGWEYVMSQRDFAGVEFKMNFERISCIATALWIIWIILTSFPSLYFNDCLLNELYPSIK